MAEIEPEVLFRHGLEAFNAGDYYDAHEYWEELWSVYQLPDRTLIQGLIQMAVGCFHITNDNLSGARGLFGKALPKLEANEPSGRGLDMSMLAAFVRQALEQVNMIETCAEFDWSLVPKLAVTEGKEA
jgi:predicted metal-dependent hydrolase